MKAFTLGLVRSVACLCALGSALILTACSQDSTDLVAYAEEVKSRPGNKVKDIVIPVWRPAPTYSQTRDPFESFINIDQPLITWTDPPNHPWPGHNPEELEHFTLDSLRMVGTLKQQDTYWGLIKSPDGVLHRVKAGNFLGKNFGKIRSVGETQIVLLEKVSDGRGHWEDRDAAMALVQ